MGVVIQFDRARRPERKRALDAGFCAPPMDDASKAAGIIVLAAIGGWAAIFAIGFDWLADALR